MGTARMWTLTGLAMLGLAALAERERAAALQHGRARLAALDQTPLDETHGGAPAPPADGLQPLPPVRRSLWRLSREQWKAVVLGVYARLNDNRLLAVAAGVVFYGILALFPAMTAFVSLYGLVADPATVHQQLALASGILPDGALKIVNEQLDTLTAQKTTALSFGFAGGLLFALWSANAGTKAVLDGLTVAYGEAETRGFIRLTLVAFAFTVGAILSLMLALTAIVVVPIMLGFVGFSGSTDNLVRVARWPALLLLVMMALALLYRFGPSRAHAHLAWITPGAVGAAAVWLIVSAAFTWYIAHFGSYDATYGSLGAAIGMMMWMWISMVVVLLGAELNAQIERTTAPSPVNPQVVS